MTGQAKRSFGRATGSTTASCVPLKSSSSRTEVKRMAKIIGIDLGTTNSEAAYMEGGTPRIIPSAEGSAYGGKMFPSLVAFSKVRILVGGPAQRQAVPNPGRNVVANNTEMGSGYNGP